MEPQTRETRDERLARVIRAQIYSGEYQAGDALPATAELAKRQGISTAMAQRAFDILRREGLVRGEHGRGTYVCDRHQWDAQVSCDRPADSRAERVARRQLAQAERDEPAVSGLSLSVAAGVGESTRWVWAMTVSAADAGPAALTAVAVARRSGAVGAGWQVAVTVTPEV